MPATLERPAAGRGRSTDEVLDGMAEDLARALNDVAIARRNLTRCFPSLRTTAARFVLLELERLGRSRVGQLADAMQVDASVTSRAVSQLVADGYVERVPDAEDRRSHELVITSDGSAHLAALRGRAAEVLVDALAGWQPAEVARLTTDLHRLRTDLEHLARGDCPPAPNAAESDDDNNTADQHQQERDVHV